MNWVELKSNISVAFVAQGFVMLLSVVQVLFVPKVLGVSQFGYLQLFLFYISFAGLFPLGLNDGIYLKHGGKKRNEINKGDIFSQMIFGLSYEIIFSAGIIAIALLGGFDTERELIIVCTGIYIVLRDVTGFLSTLFQTMNETKRSSYSTIVERSAYLCFISLLLMLQVTQFAPYIFAAMFSVLLQLLYNLYFYRDFIKAGFIGWRKAMLESFSSIRIGVKLMCANIASQLIIGLARFALDQTWGIETFGQLSLMISLVSFFLAFANQIGMVLFPALRQTSQDEIADFYAVTLNVMSFIAIVIYLLFFPLSFLIALWLPDYASALIYLGYLMPICVFDSKMNIACTTYFKVMRLERTLLFINLFAMAISAIGVTIGAFVLESVEITVASPVIAIIARSMLSEFFIAQKISIETKRNAINELLVTAAFIVCIIFFSLQQGFLLFFAICVGFFITKRSKLRQITKDIKQQVH